MEHKIIQIIQMKQEGLSSRTIASILGCSKTKVNNVYNKYVKVKGACRLLFLDIETSPDIAVSFTRFKANMTQDHILQEGGVILSVSWRYGIDGKTQGVALDPHEAMDQNDSRLIGILHDLIEESDIIVAHNGDNFDWPQVKARAVINGYQPFKKVKTIDTLKIAKTMKFQSNRLDSLAQVLGVGEKVSTGGINLWVQCMQGDPKALQKMLKYNIHDVDLLVGVYLKLRSFYEVHPNMALYQDSEGHVCRVCGSSSVELTGNTVKTPSSIFEEFKCLDCGARQRGKIALNTTEQRKQLLV